MCTKYTLSTMNDDYWLHSTLLFLMTYSNGGNYKNLFSTFKRSDILVIKKLFYKFNFTIFYLLFGR